MSAAAADVLRRMGECCQAAWRALDDEDDDALLAALDARERMQAEAAPLLAGVAAPGVGASEASADDAYALALELHRWSDALERRVRDRRDAAAAELRRAGAGAHSLSGYAAGAPATSGGFQAVG